MNHLLNLSDEILKNPNFPCTQKDFQLITNSIVNDFCVQPINVFLKDNKRGHAHWLDRWYTIPKWAITNNSIFRLYYSLHEIAHILCYDITGQTGGHDREFPEIEDTLLNMYQIKLVRRRVYPFQLYYSNRLVWNNRQNLNLEGII